MEAIVKNLREDGWVKNPAHREVYLNTLLDEKENDHVMIRVAKIMPGGEILPHTHKNQETFYFLEGEGSVLVNGERRRIGKGELVNAPAGSEHGIINDTDREILLYCVFSPIVK
jgi:quercetin dioxygenase-like cupin family protein